MLGYYSIAPRNDVLRVILLCPYNHCCGKSAVDICRLAHIPIQEIALVLQYSMHPSSSSACLIHIGRERNVSLDLTSTED